MRMEDRSRVTPGSVVQLRPNGERLLFAGCFILVKEVKSFGVQGFVAVPISDTELPGEAHCRPRWEDIEYVGQAEWVPEDVDAEGGE